MSGLRTILMTPVFTFIKLVYTVIFFFSAVLEHVGLGIVDNVERRIFSSSVPGLGLVQFIVVINQDLEIWLLLHYFWLTVVIQ